jgi:superoxide dismutase, Cu-Zn family
MMKLALAATMSCFASGTLASPDYLRANLYDTEGHYRGNVSFMQRNNTVVVNARVRGLKPGYHGFHIHATGKCDAGNPADQNNRPFTSAGPHFDKGGHTHRNHSGDMPVLLVNQNGRGTLSFVTDRVSLADLQDDDGSAVIVHANPDNYANIPTDRYTPAPDAITLAIGDSGARVACGVVNNYFQDR